MTITTDERLAQLTKESAALDTCRQQARREVDACVARMQILAQRISAIQVATTTLAHLAPLAPEHAWLDHLTAWRKALCDELLTIESPIRDKDAKLRSDSLCFSIRLIDAGLGVVSIGPVVDLTSTRVGQLMAEAGYATKGPGLRGPHGWRGSLKEVGHRIETLVKERTDAQAMLDDALLGDAERDALAVENNALRDALTAPTERRVHGDG